MAYAVDTSGNVYTCKNNRWGFLAEWKLMTPGIAKKGGYKVVDIGGRNRSGPSVGRMRTVHQLVIETFVGPAPSPKHGSAWRRKSA